MMPENWKLVGRFRKSINFSPFETYQIDTFKRNSGKFSQHTQQEVTLIDTMFCLLHFTIFSANFSRANGAIEAEKCITAEFQI